MKHHILLSLLIFLFCSPSLWAGLTVPSFFSDGMVLQREKGAKVWGNASVGDEIEVRFLNRVVTGIVDEFGEWSITLDGLPVTKEGKVLTIHSSSNETITVENVVVGDVWIAAGQSNMGWHVKNTDDAERDIADSEDSLIRMYQSQERATLDIQEDLAGEWQQASPKTTATFSATSYFFARSIREKVDVPMGVIVCAVGGKPIEAFISQKALRRLPEAQVVIDLLSSRIENWDSENQLIWYKRRVAKWNQTQKGSMPKPPVHPMLDGRAYSLIFNGTIAPIAGYTATGILWYQGEGNAHLDEGSYPHYGELLGCLAEDWRKRWGDEELSFYYVQIANFKDRRKDPTPDTPNGWVIVQDEVRRALQTIPGSGMAVTNDIGDTDDIHPRNKKAVGSRLARWALHNEYGFTNVVKSGPLYRSSTIQGDTIVVHFDYAAGLKTRDGKAVAHFEVCGEDDVWKSATATIEGEKIVVKSGKVTKPTRARYAWACDPRSANLVNGEGLPTSCFATDDNT